MTRHLVYGANHNYVPGWEAEVPSPLGFTAERRYFDGINHVPVDWDSMGCYSDFAMISLRLVPDDLLTGARVSDNGSGYVTLHRQLRTLIRTMPAGATLTLWHEAVPANNLHYPDYINGVTVPAMHAYMQQLCRTTLNRSAGHVQYGQVVIGPAASWSSWLGQGLDWYGVDIYDGPSLRNLDGSVSQFKMNRRMSNNRGAFALAAGAPTPKIHVPETNSVIDANRPNWFSYLSEWMYANNGHQVISHWKNGGPVSGPWPPSAETLGWFRELQAVYGV